MKAYTDIEQSKKLAEILPLESADMAWCNNSVKGVNYTDPFSANLYTVKEMQEAFDEALYGWEKHWKLIPCWSLAALLNVLPYPSLHKTWSGWRCDFHDKEGNVCMFGESADNQIDACIDAIIKLHEQKLL